MTVFCLDLPGAPPADETASPAALAAEGLLYAAGSAPTAEAAARVHMVLDAFASGVADRLEGIARTTTPTASSSPTTSPTDGSLPGGPSS